MAGGLPISYTEMVAYLQLYPYYDDIEQFDYFIRSMDMVFMEFSQESNKKDVDKAKNN